MWNAQVLTALIAAIAALLLAIIQALINRRNTQQIETLRSQLEHQRESSSEYLKNYLQFVIEGKEHELQAFKELLQCVQALRDKIRHVMEYPKSYDARVLHEEISALSDDVLKCFGRNQAHFSQGDMKEAHNLKTKCKIMADELLVHLEGFAGQQIALLQNNFRERAFAATKVFMESLSQETSRGTVTDERRPQRFEPS
jgi:hypothetical protein